MPTLNETLDNFKFYNETIPDWKASPYYWIFCSMFYVLVQVLGNGLLYSIRFYEKYGMDPQKRNLVNRLVSQICLAWIFHNVVNLHFIMYMALNGPLSKWPQIQNMDFK